MIPSNEPVNQPQEQAELYYKGTPSFKPRKIISTVERGTSGQPAAAPAPVVSPSLGQMVSVAETQASFAALQPQFAQVAALLDQKGASLNLCNNAADNIALRILRQKHDNETCWEFYKRMLGVARTVPTIDPNNINSFGNQLAGKGNDILNNPISPSSGTVGDPRADSFDQDPGESNLLLMLFLAILPLITNIIFSSAFTGIKWVANGVQSIINALVGGAITAPQGAAAQAQGAAANAPSGGPPIFNGDILTNVGIILTNAIVAVLVQNGPKLLEDVTRYDSLMISNYVQEMARTSMEPNWPEAVLLYAQYSALNEQMSSASNMFNYFSSNSLATSALNSSPLMPADLANVLGLQQQYTSDSLTQMTNVLTGTLVDTGFCCMLKFLGNLDPRMLMTMQGLIQVQMNGLSVQFESLDGILNNLWQQIQNTILSVVMSLLYNLLGEIESRVKPFFNGLTPGTCVQWNLLTQNMLQYVESLENKVLSLVLEYNNSLRLQNQYTGIYTQGLGQSQYLRLLNSLLQVLIDSRAAGQLCSNSNVPTDAELNQVFLQFTGVTGLSPTGTVTTTTPGQGTGTTPAPGTGAANNSFDNCLKMVSPEEVAQVQAWINQLKSMAQ